MLYLGSLDHTLAAATAAYLYRINGAGH